jgi:hypothetical protein
MIGAVLYACHFLCGKTVRNGALIISETFKPNLTGFKNLSGLVLGFIEFSFLRVKSYLILLTASKPFRISMHKWVKSEDFTGWGLQTKWHSLPPVRNVWYHD